MPNAITDNRQWVAVDAPIKNAPGMRSPEALRAVAAQFDVERNPRYRAGFVGGKPTPSTHCDCYVSDVTRAMGCEIPPSVDGETAKKLGLSAAGKPAELSANGTCAYLTAGIGGWLEVDASIAGAEAARGMPVVAAWRNPHGSGHVAILLPSAGPELRIAQAGRVNLFDVPLRKGFGAYAQFVRFFVHS